MGACFGFLWWNAPPAGIFMGDTGSLAPRRPVRRHRDDIAHRAAADRARRPVRRRDAVGDHSGRGVPWLQAAGVQHGAVPPPFRSRPAGTRTPSSCGSGSSPGSPSRSVSACSTRRSCRRDAISTVDGRRVVVAGLGVSGLAAARALLDRGARRSWRSTLATTSAVAAAAAELRARGAEVRLGDAESADRRRPGRHLARLAPGPADARGGRSATASR